jgi:hypothetical protein
VDIVKELQLASQESTIKTQINFEKKEVDWGV